MLTILANCVQNPQPTDYFSTGNRSNFRSVEGCSTARLYDCLKHCPPPYEADKCFDRVIKYYQDTVMFFDHETGQKFGYATRIAFDNNPQNVITIVFHIDEHYLLTPRPVNDLPQCYVN